MARTDPTRASDTEQPRLPAQPSNQRPRRPVIPRSWAGLIVAFLLGALVSGLITGAVVYSLNDDPRVVTRTVTVPAPDADPGTDPAGASAAAGSVRRDRPAGPAAAGRHHRRRPPARPARHHRPAADHRPAPGCAARPAAGGHGVPVRSHQSLTPA